VISTARRVSLPCRRGISHRHPDARSFLNSKFETVFADRAKLRFFPSGLHPDAPEMVCHRDRMSKAGRILCVATELPTSALSAGHNPNLARPGCRDDPPNGRTNPHAIFEMVFRRGMVSLRPALPSWNLRAASNARVVFRRTVSRPAARREVSIRSQASTWRVVSIRSWVLIRTQIWTESPGGLNLRPAAHLGNFPLQEEQTQAQMARVLVFLLWNLRRGMKEAQGFQAE
jgi:hypothetical protein